MTLTDKELRLARFIDGVEKGAAKDALDDVLDETTAALSATYGRLRQGNRFVALGDSITIGAVDNTGQALGEAWPVYASVLSQQRLHLVRDAGIGGNKTADMIARFTADVTPWAPTLVTILGGTNDYANAVTFATFKANIIALVAAVRAIAAVPVLGTIPPRTAGGYGATIVQWNAWLAYYAEQQGLALLDFYSLLTDPATGNYLAAYDSGDGIHPSALGHRDMGELAAYALEPLLPPNAVLLAISNVDTNNLLTNGLFINSTGGMGNNWTLASGTTGVTRSIVTDPAVKGNMQRVVGVAAAGQYVQQQTISTGFAVGDTLRASGVVTSDGGSTAQILVGFTGSGGSAKQPITLSKALTRGVWTQDLVVPAGCTSIDYKIAAGAPGASWDMKFGQVGLFNLTTMGTLT